MTDEMTPEEREKWLDDGFWAQWDNLWFLFLEDEVTK
jgi:hypothetical protein